jgi:hypothetical protein
MFPKTREEYITKKINYGKDKNIIVGPGPILLDSLPIEIVDEYENKYNLTLPEDFRNYILNVSRETIGYYTYEIKLGEFKKPWKVWLEDDKLYNCEFGARYKDDASTEKYTKDEMRDRGYSENYFIKVFENGCTDDDFLCVKGPHKGEWWKSINGGDYFSCSFSIRDTVKYQKPLTTEELLRLKVENLNIMRVFNGAMSLQY